MSGSREFSTPIKASEWRPVADVVASSHVEPDNPQPALEDQPICWICLDSATPTQPLIQPCKCPRQAHPTCVARWQLQSAGTRKETHCEFCDQNLPDWKKTLTPQCGANAPAIMNVNFNDRTFSFEVKPGVDGYKQFTEAIRHAFHLPEDSELNITFTCDEPVVPAGDGSPTVTTPEQAAPSTPAISPSTPRMEPMGSVPTTPTVPTTPNSASLLTLQGAGAYDAAVHCASVSAAKRLQQGSPGSGTPGGHRGVPGPLVRQLPQSYSTIPGYNRAITEQNLQQAFHRERAQANPAPVDMRRPFAGHSGRGFPHLPNIEDHRHTPAASVPRRNSTASMLQRATKVVRKFTGRKGDRE